mgnify:CR=1 FL=1
MHTKIKAAHIIAFDGYQHIDLQNGELVYSGDTIKYVGPSYPGEVDKTIDLGNKLVFPGLISIHGHVTDAPFNKSYLEDSASKNFFQSTLYEYLMIIWPTPEEAIVGAKASVVEMLRNGCTTFVDMTPDYPAYGVTADLAIPELVAETVGEMGARAYIVPTYRSGIWYTDDGKKVSYKWLEDEGQSGLAKNISFIEKYHGSFEGRIMSMIGPAQVDTCTKNLLEKSVRAANDLNVGITIHAAQSINEFHTIIQRYGMTPIHFLESVGILSSKTIVAHAVFLSGHSMLGYPGDDDLQLLSDSGASVAHSPRVFCEKGSLMESFAKYKKYGINIGMATDTVPLNILDEMRLANVCCKLAERSTYACTARDIFDAATLGSAKALGREDLGRIAAGAKADLVVVNLDTLRMSPVRDVMKSLFYHATAKDIEMVIINGKVIVKDGKMENIDEALLSKQLQTATERMWGNMSKLDWAGRDVDEIAPHLLKKWSNEIK